VQEQSNLEVSDLLYKYCGTEKWRSAKIDMHALPIGFGDSVRYWSDVVIQDDNGLFIPFFDHRRTKGLKGIQENRFVFSMQNFWIRERFLDLRSARLAVISFPTARKMRGLSIQFGKEEELMSYDELDSRVRRVYEAWAKVSEERTTKRRETGTDGPTPFGF